MQRYNETFTDHYKIGGERGAMKTQTTAIFSLTNRRGIFKDDIDYLLEAQNFAEKSSKLARLTEVRSRFEIISAR